MGWWRREWGFGGRGGSGGSGCGGCDHGVTVYSDFFTETNGRRKLTPKKGTPRFGVGDQLHYWIKNLIHKELDRLGSMTPNDLTRMPDKALLRTGGLFVTTAGVKRGAKWGEGNPGGKLV